MNYISKKFDSLYSHFKIFDNIAYFAYHIISKTLICSNFNKKENKKELYGKICISRTAICATQIMHCTIPRAPLVSSTNIMAPCISMYKCLDTVYSTRRNWWLFVPIHWSVVNPTASNVDWYKCFIDDSNTMNSFAGVIGISNIIRIKDYLPLIYMIVILLVNWVC